MFTNKINNGMCNNIESVEAETKEHFLVQQKTRVNDAVQNISQRMMCL